MLIKILNDFFLGVFEMPGLYSQSLQIVQVKKIECFSL